MLPCAGNPFVVYIFALSGGTTLSGSSLFSQALGTDFGGFSLTPNLLLTPGALYAVLVGNQGFLGLGNGGDFYPGGHAVDCGPPTDGSSCVAGFGSGDLIGFAVTFAPAVTVTPEPATFGLLAIGLGMLSGLSIRRRRSAGV